MVVWPKVPPAREGRGGSKYHPDYPPVGGVVKISWSGRRHYPPRRGRGGVVCEIWMSWETKFTNSQILKYYPPDGVVVGVVLFRGWGGTGG